MAQFTVNLEGGGQIVVNASSPQAAMENAGSPSGAYVTSGSYTGGPGQPTGAQPAPSTPAPTPGNNPTQANLDATQLILGQAQQAAYQAYLNAKLNLDTDELAFKKATQAFQNAISEAQLTGTYQGQATLAGQAQQFNQQQALAGLYGQAYSGFGQVPAGAQTLAAQLQAANQLGTYQGQQTLAAQLQAANLLGTYQGQQTLAAQGQAFNQALAAQQEARARETAQQNTAQQYLNLLSQLQGPSNYFKYQNVLGSTPQGMSDLVRAAAGQYVPGTGATTGVQPTAMTLQSLVGDVGGANAAANAQAQQALQGLPAPNQIAAQSWNALTPSQKQLLVAAYQQQGWNADDVTALFQQSLPKYATSAPQVGAFKLV